MGMHGIPPTSFGAHDQGKYMHSFDGTITVGYSSHKSKGRPVPRVSYMAPDWLNSKKFCDLLCVIS